MRILVVEDQEVLLDLVDRQLSHLASVLFAVTRERRLLTSSVHDSGNDNHRHGNARNYWEHVLRYVRGEFGSLPVILMIGNPDNRKQKCFEGNLAKPFSMRELWAVIENARG